MHDWIPNETLSPFYVTADNQEFIHIRLNYESIGRGNKKINSIQKQISNNPNRGFPISVGFHLVPITKVMLRFQPMFR